MRASGAERSVEKRVEDLRRADVDLRAGGEEPLDRARERRARDGAVAERVGRVGEDVEGVVGRLRRLGSHDRLGGERQVVAEHELRVRHRGGEVRDAKNAAPAARIAPCERGELSRRVGADRSGRTGARLRPSALRAGGGSSGSSLPSRGQSPAARTRRDRPRPGSARRSPLRPPRRPRRRTAGSSRRSRARSGR